jgi:hypothetical protein
MANEDTVKISCPKCKHKFILTEALAAPLVEAAQREADTRLVEALEAEKQTHADALAKARAAGEGAAASKALKETAELRQKIEAAAKEAQEAQRRLADQDDKLKAAQVAQAEAVRKGRELDDAKRELELTVQARVASESEVIRQAAQRAADNAAGLRLQEREAVIDAMKAQIDELKRKAEQGDQRLQGEVQELALERMLREAFPGDTVEPVAKGVYGGDTLLRVIAAGGAVAGSILFESKRTKSWEPKWLEKLRADQRAAQADVAILVSQTLPKGLEGFALIDGVWVVGVPLAMALTSALRSGIQEAHHIRRANDGMETKAGLVYSYLTGPAFKRRLQALIEAVSALQGGLAKERAAIERQWALRETTHNKAVAAIMGLAGDLGGVVAGTELPSLDDLGKLPEVAS